ncbi:hypothetical protein HK405_000819, partial [Cladochytrium tenue]
MDKLDEAMQALAAEHQSIRQAVGEETVRAFDLGLLHELFNPASEALQTILAAAAADSSSAPLRHATYAAAAAGAAASATAASAAVSTSSTAGTSESARVGTIDLSRLLSERLGYLSEARTGNIRSITAPLALKKLQICLLCDCT